MTEVVPFPSREVLLAGVKKVLATYAGTAVTVRQLYYRLVAGGIVPNNLRSYKNLVSALSVWRRARTIPFSAFEDLTRGMNRLDAGWRNHKPNAWLKSHLNAGLENAAEYDLARWFGQAERVVVAVEKQALQGPFTEVCQELGVDLMVCRGYPSLSFLNEVAGALASNDYNRDARKNVIIYFGDFDPSGMNIPETVERDLSGVFGRRFTLERIALVQEQVDTMDLIPAPVKLGDSRATGFIAEHGEDVYELDAIEPTQLQDLIRTAINAHFDNDKFAEREQLVAEGRAKLATKIDELGLQQIVDDLEDEED